MKPTRITRGRIAGSYNLLFVIALFAPAFFSISVAMIRGTMMDLTTAALFTGSWCWFFYAWISHLKGDSVIDACEDSLLIREKHRQPLHVNYTDLKTIHEDSRGFTLHLVKGDRFRLLHKDMTDHMSCIVDRLKYRLEYDAYFASLPPLPGPCCPERDV